jgi:hypothetical protein
MMRSLAMRFGTLTLLLLAAGSARANLPPLCGSAVGALLELWPPNHKFVSVGVDGLLDPDDDPLTVRVNGVTQDEAVDGSGDGSSCPDAGGVGTAAASLRSERSGEGDGRVYHVDFSAFDPSGSSCQGAFVVCVPHDRGQGSSCTDGGELFDSTVCPAPPQDCDLDDCVPGDDDVKSVCDDDELPKKVAKRVARARALLAKAAVSTGKKQARLGRKAAKLLRKAGQILGKKAPDICNSAMGSILDGAADCAECNDHDGADSGNRDGDD